MKQVKIMLDAGHYGILADITRDRQENDLSLDARGKSAEGYDLFLSIQSNAVGSGIDNSVDYPVAVTLLEDEKISIDEESLLIGEKLAKKYVVWKLTST